MNYRSVILRYAFAAAATAGAIGLRLILSPLMIEGHFNYPFLLAVALIVAWYAGFWPSAVSVVLGAAGVIYFFLEPTRAFSAHNPQELTELAVYLLLGCMLAFLGSSMRRTRQALYSVDRRHAPPDKNTGAPAAVCPQGLAAPDALGFTFRGVPLLAPISIFLISLAATGLIAVMVWNSAELDDEDRFQNALERTTDRITDRIETYIAVLNAGRGLFAASNEVGRDEFGEFVDQFRLQAKYPGIQGIGFTRRVLAAEKDAFVQDMRRAGVPGGQDLEQFHIWPDYERPEYHAIIYLEPMDRRNRFAIGYDMFTEATRREAMERARDTGKAAASARVTLVQEIDEQKQAGFLIYVPVYRGGSVPETVEQRRSDLIGFVYSPFRAEDLFSGIFGSESRPRVEFEVYDGEVAAPEGMLRPAGSDFSPDTASHSTTRQVNVAGRPWTIAFATRTGFDEASSQPFGWVVIGGGILVSLLFFAIALRQADALRQRQIATVALRVSEGQLRSTLESITDGFFSVDGNWRFTYINAEAERVCDLRRLEVLGRTWQEVFPLAVGTELENRLRRCMQDRVPIEMENFYEPWQRWFQLKAYPTEDGGFSQYFRDITQQKRDEEQRERWQQTLSDLIERCPFGIYIVDSDFRIAQMNIGSQNGAFLNVRPIIGRPFDEAMHILWPEGVAEEVIGHFRQTLETGEAYSSRDFVNPRADKDEVEGYEWELHRLTLPDGAFGVVCYYYDSTRLRRIEHELRLSNEREKALRVEAESANRAKDEFLALLSHELRTPLNSISGWTQIVLESPNDADAVRKGIETIDKNVRLQGALIEDLLDVSRIITGRMKIEERSVPFAQVVRATVEAAVPAAKNAGVAVASDIDPDAGHVVGDRQRLRQIVGNLLANAIKFTPEGGSVTVTLTRGRDKLRLVVRDTGVGIPAHVLPQVFKRFWQADVSYRRKYGGLGLGLAIVENLVHLHGGTVSAASDGANKGAEFVVELPAEPVPAGDGTTTGAQRAGTAERNGLSGLSVLIVDDDRENLELMRVALEGSGARTVTCDDAVEALKELENGGFDVLLSDIGMPDLDGYELMRAVRSMHSSVGTVPAIALSGYVSAEDRERSLAAGFQRHLSKPVDLTKLRETIKSLAGRGGGEGL